MRAEAHEGRQLAGRGIAFDLVEVRTEEHRRRRRANDHRGGRCRSRHCRIAYRAGRSRLNRQHCRSEECLIRQCCQSTAMPEQATPSMDSIFTFETQILVCPCTYRQNRNGMADFLLERSGSQPAQQRNSQVLLAAWWHSNRRNMTILLNRDRISHCTRSAIHAPCPGM